jgi:predicted transcriptional regulator
MGRQMSKEAVFTLKLEPDLRDQFVAEAQAAHRPASQVVRELMRDYIDRQQAARDHDSWFRAEVEQGLREADDPGVKRIPNAEVSAKWRRRRADLMQRAGERPDAD